MQYESFQWHTLQGAHVEIYYYPEEEPLARLALVLAEQSYEDLTKIETAQRICTACTVRDECLEFALATNQEAGIWGGTTEEERRKLRKAWLAKQRLYAS